MTPEQRELAVRRYNDAMQQYGKECLQFLAELYGSDPSAGGNAMPTKI